MMASWDAWFAEKTFTTDRASNHFANWARHIGPFRERAVNVLEVGSWEGRSAIFFLEYLSKCRITCIDTFAGGAEHHDRNRIACVEARFDANLASYRDRVRKMKSRSLLALDQLAQEDALFEIIYIDGSHQRDDVLVDSILAWRLLAPDGICIWDDYSWGWANVPSADRPQEAIDVFLAMHAGELKVIHSAAPIIAQRTPGGTERPNVFPIPRTPANLIRFLMRRPLRRERDIASGHVHSVVRNETATRLYAEAPASEATHRISRGLRIAAGMPFLMLANISGYIADFFDWLEDRIYDAHVWIMPNRKY